MSTPIKTILIMVGVLGLSVAIGGQVVKNGLVAGLLTFAAIWVLLQAVPSLQRVIQGSPLVVDFLVTGGVFYLNPVGGITALVAAATVGILFTITVRLPRTQVREVSRKVNTGLRREVEIALLGHKGSALAKQRKKERERKGIKWPS